MDMAFKYDYLELVKFLHENRTEWCTVKAMDYACQNGHLNVVKSLHKNKSEGWTSSTKFNFIKNGYTILCLVGFFNIYMYWVGPVGELSQSILHFCKENDFILLLSSYLHIYLKGIQIQLQSYPQK